MNSEVEYLDTESGYSFDKKKISFREIIILQVKKIGDIWSKESFSKENFTNAVYALRAYLKPYYDDEMNKADTQNLANLDNQVKNVLDSEGNLTDDYHYIIVRFNNAVNLFTDLNIFLNRKRYLEIQEIND